MSIEEAIKILEESQRQNRVMLESPTTFFRVSEVEKGVKNAEQRITALDMAIAALRAQTDFNGTYVNVSWLKQVEAERDALKNAKLNRSLWKGCDICKTKGYLCGTIYIMPSLYSTQRTLFLFCPDCGRPLTEEAWAELERRRDLHETD